MSPQNCWQSVVDVSFWVSLNNKYISPSDFVCIGISLVSFLSSSLSKIFWGVFVSVSLFLRVVSKGQRESAYLFLVVFSFIIIHMVSTSNFSRQYEDFRFFRSCYLVLENLRSFQYVLAHSGGLNSPKTLSSYRLARIMNRRYHSMRTTPQVLFNCHLLQWVAMSRNATVESSDRVEYVSPGRKFQ